MLEFLHAFLRHLSHQSSIHTALQQRPKKWQVVKVKTPASKSILDAVRTLWERRLAQKGRCGDMCKFDIFRHILRRHHSGLKYFSER